MADVANRPPAIRLQQAILIISTVLGSWLGAQAVHESGHAVAAMLSGGRVVRVVLNPLTISRTDLATNPNPLLVVWAGPIVGVIVPLVLWRGAAGMRMRGVYVLRFFAGFCLIGNGAYVGAGSLGRVGDCAEMLRHGSPIWLLWLFGAATIPMGLWLWHGQGRHFGLGASRGKVDVRMAYVCAAVFATLLAVGFGVDGR